MANFTLTVDADTVAGGAADDTVNGTAATLNAGDSLTGGAGTDVLALDGSGAFRVDQLATFTGFESITLNNTSDEAILFLGSESIAVTGYGAGWESLFLGSGAVTFVGGSGPNRVHSNSASNWNVGNSIDGGSYGANLDLNSYRAENADYDLTTNTLSHINYLYGYGANLTVKVNSAVAGGVANFSADTFNTELMTSDAALDLSHSSVSGFKVVSSNATGTNFIVHDIGTAFRIAGGSGDDTITAEGFVFSADQRDGILSNGLVEHIVDASGTYTAPTVNTAPTITSNGGGNSAALSVAENTTAITTVTATDPDAGQTMRYSISGGADWSKFTIDYTTGALSFFTAPNFEEPTDVGANNIYDVIVQVYDLFYGFDTQAIAVRVTDLNEAPTIISNGGGNTAAASILENTTAVTIVRAVDADAGQTPTYSITGGADASKFTIDSSTGALSFVTALNFELPADAGGNNVYDVTVQASDGNGGIDTQAIAVTVTDVYLAPAITSNGGNGTAAVSIAENTTVVTTVTATNPEGGKR